VTERKRVSRSKLTKPLVDELVEILSAGNYIETACRSVNLPRGTFDTWHAKGRRGEKPYADFVERIDQARALGEIAKVAKVTAAADDDWRAAAWLLERQYPDRWGKASITARPHRATQPPPVEKKPEPVADDPFGEVDELARKRRSIAN